MASDGNAAIIAGIATMAASGGGALSGLLGGLWVPGKTHEREIAELKREMGERLQRLEQIIADQEAELKVYRAGVIENARRAHEVSKAVATRRRDGAA